MQLPDIDFNSLEIREIGDWPLILRVGVIVGSSIALLALLYFFVFTGSLEELTKAKESLVKKREEFREQYTMAVNLDQYKAQMQEMQALYKEYIQQLPTSSNIPELIDNLTKIGEANGLQINSIKLGDPKLVGGFYMSLPLTLSIIGGYHNIGLFVNETAKLARIVTFSDFNIKPASGAPNGVLQMDMQADTYWIASQLEIDSQKSTDDDDNKRSNRRGSSRSSNSPGTPASGGN